MNGKLETVGLTDLFASRRYFNKFETITAHLGRVAGVMEAEGNLNRDEVKILTRYLAELTFTFRALGQKYLLVGRDTGRFFGSLAIDAKESGFPAAEEIITMASDAQQAQRHLEGMASAEDLKKQMVEVSWAIRRCPQSFNLPCRNGFIMKICCGEICFGRAMILRLSGLATWLLIVGPFGCTGLSTTVR